MGAETLVAGGLQLGSAALGSKGASKANKVAAQTADKQIALAREFQANAENRYANDIAQANQASNIYSGLIGAGDPAQAQAGWNAFKQGTGYQSQFNDAMAAVNANAAARGFLRSGAAFQGAEETANNLAARNFGQYAQLVNQSVQNGLGAKASITNAGQTALGFNQQALQQSGETAGGAALAQSSLFGNALNNIGTMVSNKGNGTSYKGGVK